MVNRIRRKEAGLIPTKEGNLFVPSARLLLVGDGATSYPLKKVLHPEVDTDAKQIPLTLDGRQRPVVLALPDAIVTGAVIERPARDAEARSPG